MLRKNNTQAPRHHRRSRRVHSAQDTGPRRSSDFGLVSRESCLITFFVLAQVPRCPGGFSRTWLRTFLGLIFHHKTRVLFPARIHIPLPPPPPPPSTSAHPPVCICASTPLHHAPAANLPLSRPSAHPPLAAVTLPACVQYHAASLHPSPLPFHRPWRPGSLLTLPAYRGVSKRVGYSMQTSACVRLDKTSVKRLATCSSSTYYQLFMNDPSLHIP